MAGGGGGQSGTVGFPTYMQDQHEDWLTTDLESMANLITSAIQGNSPLSFAFAYNPEPDLNDAQGIMDSLNDLAVAYNETSDWEAAIDSVVSKLNGAVLTTANIASAVARFDANNVIRLQQSQSRMAGGFADINSVNSPAFVIGGAMMELQHHRESQDLESKLELQHDRERVFASLQSAAEIMKGHVTEFDMQRTTAAMQMEMSKMTIISQTERLEAELAIDIQDWEYDMNVYQYGQNLLAGISGAPTVPKPTPKLQSALGGLLGGAQSFGQLGAGIGGNEGALLFSILGAGLGGIGGLL